MSLCNIAYVSFPRYDTWIFHIEASQLSAAGPVMALKVYTVACLSTVLITGMEAISSKVSSLSKLFISVILVSFEVIGLFSLRLIKVYHKECYYRYFM